MGDAEEAVTRRLLIDAGIGAGMRVLDVGCGWGRVSLLLAELVAGTGEVVGVDRDAGPLEVARTRVKELGLSNVGFAQADFRALPAEQGDFDAVVGRRVLMYQPDPVEAVRSLVRVLRPGGVVVFQEHDATIGPTSIRPLPLHAKVHAWIWRTVQREGADVHMGFGLASVLARVGLVGVQVRAEAMVQTPTTPSTVGTIVRNIMPRILEQGVATEEEIDVDTLDERLTKERSEADASYIGELVFGAWARRSSSAGR